MSAEQVAQIVDAINGVRTVLTVLIVLTSFHVTSEFFKKS